MVQIKGLGVTGTSTGSVLQALGGPRFYCIQSYQFSLVTPYSKQNHCQTPTPLGDNPLKILKMGQSFPIGMIGICRIHRISKSTPKLLKHGAKHGARSSERSHQIEDIFVSALCPWGDTTLDEAFREEGHIKSKSSLLRTFEL